MKALGQGIEVFGGNFVKSLLLINRPNQVKRKKIDWIEEPIPPDHPRAMI